MATPLRTVQGGRAAVLPRADARRGTNFTDEIRRQLTDEVSGRTSSSPAACPCARNDRPPRCSRGRGGLSLRAALEEYDRARGTLARDGGDDRARGPGGRLARSPGLGRRAARRGARATLAPRRRARGAGADAPRRHRGSGGRGHDPRLRPRLDGRGPGRRDRVGGRRRARAAGCLGRGTARPQGWSLRQVPRGGGARSSRWTWTRGACSRCRAGFSYQDSVFQTARRRRTGSRARPSSRSSTPRRSIRASRRPPSWWTRPSRSTPEPRSGGRRTRPTATMAPRRSAPGSSARGT